MFGASLSSIISVNFRFFLCLSETLKLLRGSFVRDLPFFYISNQKAQTHCESKCLFTWWINNQQ
jgi:hypothetical protein